MNSILRFSLARVLLLFMAASLNGLMPLAWGQGAELAKGQDPAIWTKPNEPPAMREVLKGKAYEEAFAKAMEVIDRLTKDDAKPKLWRPSLIVASVERNSPAHRQGILPLDRLLTLNGKTLWHRNAVMPWNENGNQLIERVNFFGKLSILTVKTDALEGAELYNNWDHFSWILARQNRNPLWDKEVLVGVSQASITPDLAETAWFHAIRKGYKPDTITWWCGAQIAALQYRSKEVFDFAAFIPVDVSKMPDPIPFEADNLQRSLWAIGNYRLELFPNFVGDMQEKVKTREFVTRLEELRKIHNSRPEEIRLLPPPSQRALGFKRVDIMDMVVSTDQPPRTDMIKNLQMRATMLYPAETGTYLRLLCGLKGPLTRAEFIVEFKLQETDSNQSRYAKSLAIGLVESGTMAGEPITFTIQRAAYKNAYFELCLGNSIWGPTFQWTDTGPLLDGKTVHTVRIIRFDGQVELFFNGHRIAYLPVDDKIKTTDFMIKAQGLTATIQKVRMYEFVEKDKTKAPEAKGEDQK